MTALRNFSQIAINARIRFLPQIAQQPKLVFTSLCWNKHRNEGPAIVNNNIPTCSSISHITVNNNVAAVQNFLQYQQRRFISNKASPDHAGKTESKSSAAITNDDIFAESSKLGLFARFKLMYKKYWYVLIPVHIVTSLGWFGGFYYMAQSGVDIASLLEQLHVSESIIDKMQNSKMGHLAIAYLCYKVATPIRYAVTLGGTTVSIKYLVQSGHIKPLPSKQEFMDMYEQKMADRAAAKEKEK